MIVLFICKSKMAEEKLILLARKILSWDLSRFSVNLPFMLKLKSRQ